MAFKRSGVRLPLAPPLNYLIRNVKVMTRFHGSYFEQPREAPGKHEMPHSTRRFAQYGRDARLPHPGEQ
jgi:hypothetical protein